MTNPPHPSTPPPLHGFSLWLPVVLWCSLIFYLSHQPHLRITQEWWDIIVRKVAHMVEYGVLALLLRRAIQGSTSWDEKRIWRWALIGAILYAASDEFHQHFIEGRVGSPVDVLVDALGALAAWALDKRFRKPL